MMTPFRLVIPERFFQEMLVHARAADPLECCGLLSGSLREGVAIASNIHPLVNELASATEYRSEARSLFAAMKQMRAASVELLAIYHSHPRSSPIPSRHDLERNSYEGVQHLIIGLAAEPPDVRGWWLTAAEYAPAKWERTGLRGAPETRVSPSRPSRLCYAAHTVFAGERKSYFNSHRLINSPGHADPIRGS